MATELNATAKRKIDCDTCEVSIKEGARCRVDRKGDQRVIRCAACCEAGVPATIVHKFELAGLGNGPFRCTGHSVLKFQAAPDAPIQPGGTCDYCGAAIMDAYWIESADGKEFKVGSDCVYKTGDAGMVDTVKREANRIKNERRRERERARINAARELLPGVADLLRAEPHPHPHFAEEGKTKLDWIEWMLERAGNRGGVDAAKVVEKLARKE